MGKAYLNSSFPLGLSQVQPEAVRLSAGAEGGGP
jgi:hypothetical protein